jgi:hypothetical protein
MGWNLPIIGRSFGAYYNIDEPFRHYPNKRSYPRTHSVSKYVFKYEIANLQRQK